MIRDYNTWLNESIPTGKEFATQFIEKLKATDFGKWGEFSDWWTVPKKDYENEDIAYIESLERIQRNKPERDRHGWEIYMIEFKIFLHPEQRKDYLASWNSSHVWRLSHLDSTNFDLKLNSDMFKLGELGNMVKAIFDETLKKLFPSEYQGRKYGI